MQLQLNMSYLTDSYSKGSTEVKFGNNSPYTMSQKTVQIYLCQNFGKFPPNSLFLAKRWERG